MRFTTRLASSRPKTALFGNLGVRLQIFLCGVQEYASAQILIFLDLAQKSLVFASGTALSPSEFSDGNMMAPARSELTCSKTGPKDKLRSLSSVAEACKRWRTRGFEIVLANGAFDVLHVGHLRYLSDARAHGDRMVVAVNSDASVHGAKGPLRPIVPEGERVELLSHLWMIDLIVLFDSATVAPILERLRPQIHAKGTDYTVDTVPEREIVAAYGGRTIICGDPKDHATTDFIGLILERFGTV